MAKNRLPRPDLHRLKLQPATFSPEKLDHIPHSLEAEQGALGCVLIACDYSLGALTRNKTTTDKQIVQDATAETDLLLEQLRPALFFDLRHKSIFSAMIAIRMGGHILNSHTLQQYLRDQKQEDDAGGLSYWMGFPDKAVSAFNFHTFLGILRDKWLRRYALAKREQLTGLALSEELAPEQLNELFSDIAEHSRKIGTKQPALKIWRANALLAYKPPAHLRLVGDNEICMGYDGVTLVAGPGSSGKSLAVAALALAGAIGEGTWMGRPVHRKFKTLILQAENGSVRLKNEIEAMARNHPHVDIDGSIFISEPPEGGLPFHHAEFRTAVRREVEQLKPDLIVLDPWSQVAAEDSAKDVVDKIGEIRSCFPSGEHCPGLLIVAHTKKPRPEDVRRGRAMVNLISGSIALANTARCAYMLLPWSDDLEDERIYWACPKLNNGQMYGASVWKRRFGTFFVQDTETDPKTWGEETRENELTRRIRPEDVRKAYEGLSTLKKSDLAKRLEKNLGVAYSTVMHAITKGPRGYLCEMFTVDGHGYLELKKEAE